MKMVERFANVMVTAEKHILASDGVNKALLKRTGIQQSILAGVVSGKINEKNVLKVAQKVRDNFSKLSEYNRPFSGKPKENGDLILGILLKK
jgi:hypothetical protein